MNELPKLGKRLVWWWCQDDECDCTQPKIEEVVPWVHDRHRVLEVEAGPFVSPTHSCQKSDTEEQEAWAKDACARHGVEYFPSWEAWGRQP